MKIFKIAVIPGDGIGKEVVPEGLRVLEAAGRRFELKFSCKNFDWSCETYVKTGKMMPDDGLEQLRPFDAIFLGAVGYPGRRRSHFPVGTSDSHSAQFSAVREFAPGAVAEGNPIAAPKCRAGANRFLRGP